MGTHAEHPDLGHHRTRLSEPGAVRGLIHGRGARNCNQMELEHEATGVTKELDCERSILVGAQSFGRGDKNSRT